MKAKSKTKELTGEDFDAMTAAQKEKIYQDIDRAARSGRIKTTAPTRAEQAMLNRLARKLNPKPGRPKIGRGTRIISVTVEAELLERADAFARSAGLKRSELITRGLRRVVPAA